MYVAAVAPVMLVKLMLSEEACHCIVDPLVWLAMLTEVVPPEQTEVAAEAIVPAVNAVTVIVFTAEETVQPLFDTRTLKEVATLMLGVVSELAVAPVIEV